MSKATITTATLGVPRIGRRRELKFALEAYWAGKSSETELLTIASALRAANWKEQRDQGIVKIPSNDFSLYDHVLDMVVTVGAIPARYGWNGGEVSLDTYFAMARGSQGEVASCGHAHHGHGTTAMEMTKWFDTNYHYMVPELSDDQEFRLSSTRIIDHFLEAKALGIHTRPVILGPVTFLKLAKSTSEGFNAIALLPKLLPVYEQLLRELAVAGADWVQIDEPALVLDLIPNELAAFELAYKRLTSVSGPKILLATYFGALGANLDTAISLPVAGLHVDLARAPKQLSEVVSKLAPEKVLSLGVIDGRNIWRTDLVSIINEVQPVVEQRGPQSVEIAPSCSLLHVPVDLELETGLDADLKSWLSFATQKLDELATLGKALGEGKATVAAELEAASKAVAARASSPKVTGATVQKRIATIGEADRKRVSPFAERQKVQSQAIALPLFPTTTIGSFPQTPEVRKARSAHSKGALTDAQYEGFLQKDPA